MAGGGLGKRSLRRFVTSNCFEVTVSHLLCVQLAAELVVSQEDEERRWSGAECRQQGPAPAVGQRLESAADERSRTGGRIPGNG